MVQHAGLQAAHPFRGLGMGGQADDGQVRPDETNLAGQCVAVHHRHLDVGQHNVPCARAGCAHLFERQLPVVGQGDVRTLFHQHVLNHHLVDLVVFGNEDAQAAESGQKTSPRCGHVNGNGHLFGFDRGATLEPCSEPEGAACARRADEPRFATHQFGQSRRDGQAQPGATVLAGGGGIGLLKGVEQLGLLLRRDANAAVLHLKAHQQVILICEISLCA